jgi:hypothetical protein
MPSLLKKPDMHIGHYIDMVHRSEQDLAKAFRKIAKEHRAEADIEQTCDLLAGWSDELVKKIAPFAAKYGKEKDKEPDKLMSDLFQGPRKGGLALLRDLQDLWLMANEGEVCAIILRQAASALRDKELIEVCNAIEEKSKRQVSWLLTRMKSAAPQALVAAA